MFSRPGSIAGSGPQSIKRNSENPVDLLGVGGADCGDAADHLGDVGDVGIGADYASLLGSFEQGLAGAVDGAAAGGEDLGVAVDVGEQVLGEGALGGGEADELVQPAAQCLPGRQVFVALDGAADVLDALQIDGFEQVLASGEVAVERADADAGAARDLLEGG